MSFKPTQPKFSFGRSSGGFGSAAGMVDLSGAFQAQRRNAPKFDELYATGIANRANERSGIMEAKAAIIGQGLAAEAAVDSAELLADAQVKAAKFTSICCRPRCNNERHRLNHWSRLNASLVTVILKTTLSVLKMHSHNCVS